MKTFSNRYCKIILITIIVSLSLIPAIIFAAGEKMVGPPITLKLSHQWPQDPDDYVIKTAIRFAEMAEKRSGGAIKIQFYPAQSLSPSAQQFRGMRTGVIDMSIFPVVYAAGEIPELQLTHAPWWPTNHDHFYRLKDSEVWRLLETEMNKAGVKSLCWIQIAGGIASRGKAVTQPEDLKGMAVRSSGKAEEWLIEACGAGLASMPSSETYIAMQRGVLDAMQTSSSSFAAYKIWEVAPYYLSPEKYCTYFTTEPIQISMKTWDKLTPEQQKILIAVGQELEPFALQSAKEEDTRVAKLFADHGCKVTLLTEENNNKFREMAQKYVVPRFIKEVRRGEWLVNGVKQIPY